MSSAYNHILAPASICTEGSTCGIDTSVHCGPVPRRSTASTYAPSYSLRSTISSASSLGILRTSNSPSPCCSPREHNEELGGKPRATRGVQKSAVVSRHAHADFVEKHYDFVQELGQGAHGRVHLVIDRKTCQRRVCKFVSTNGMDAVMLNMMKQEVDVLSELDHPNIVKVFEYAFDDKRSQLVMVIEYLRGGDCYSLLEEAKGTPVNEALIARIIYQVLIALRYCHSRGLIHMDVKPENIMLVACVEADSTLAEAKLIDFGGSGVPINGLFGTIPYIAPEVIVCANARSGGVDISGKADLWSLGVSAFVLLMDEQPFLRHTRDATISAITNYACYHDVENMFSHLPAWRLRSSEAHDFSKSLLAADPTSRPSAEKALMHPWIQMYAWAQMYGGARDSLGAEMVQSLSAYQTAPPVARCCLYVIAARLGVPDLERFGATFLRLDTDGDGMIKSDDLVAALSKLEDGSFVNVDYILSAADLDHTGGIAFTEFVAACLYERFVSSGSLMPIMEQAFQALDDDRDGFITFEQVESLFRERDALTLQCLPQERPFSVDEWCTCLSRTHSLQTSQLRRSSSVTLISPIEPPQLLDQCIGALDFAHISMRNRES